MKRIISLFLILVMLFTIVACNDTTSNIDSVKSNEETNTSKTTTNTDNSTDNSGNPDNSDNSEDNINGNGSSSVNDGSNNSESLENELFTFHLNEDKVSYTVNVFSEEIFQRYDNLDAFRADYEEILTMQEIVIPETYQGKEVTKIGSRSFQACSSLMKITIPERATLPSLHPQNNYCTL